MSFTVIVVILAFCVVIIAVVAFDLWLIFTKKGGKIM